MAAATIITIDPTPEVLEEAEKEEILEKDIITAEEMALMIDIEKEEKEEIPEIDTVEEMKEMDIEEIEDPLILEVLEAMNALIVEKKVIEPETVKNPQEEENNLEEIIVVE